MDTFLQTLRQPPPVLVAGLILIYFLAALLVSWLARRIVQRLLALRIIFPSRRYMSRERQQTLVGLVSSLVTLLAFIVAFLAALSLFVEADTLIWVVGLFSAAFGLGARALVADVLAGGRFIFRNTFAIGEKIELTVAGTKVEGTVEEVNVTNTMVRAPTGEVFVVPNGDITVIRNFSRAPYSTVVLRFKVPSDQVLRARETLEAMSQEAADVLAALTEPWKVISTSEELGSQFELTVTGHTPYGKAASLKLEMADLISRRLQEAGIEVKD